MRPPCTIAIAFVSVRVLAHQRHEKIARACACEERISLVMRVCDLTQTTAEDRCYSNDLPARLEGATDRDATTLPQRRGRYGQALVRDSSRVARHVQIRSRRGRECAAD